MFKKPKIECKIKIGMLHANKVFGHILSVFTKVDPNPACKKVWNCKIVQIVNTQNGLTNYTWNKT